MFAGLVAGCGAGGQVGDSPATAGPSASVGGEQADNSPATAVPGETPVPAPPFRVIAYVTSAIIPELIPYARLTHINYAFLIPNADGTFAPLANGWKLKEIVSRAHQAEVQVLISVGGWGWDEEFETMAADPALRSVFVENLSAFVDEYALDGADIDWEYPDPGQSAQNFLALIGELRLAMPDKLLTTAVVSYGENGGGVASETFELFDFVNVMTYDGPDHGTMEQFNAGLEYWQERGLPPEKTVMGVPFYAEPGSAIYRKIVEDNPQAAYVDTIEYQGAPIHYNGILTIQAKTQIAMQRAGGIMFWTLDHDALDDLSLLKAIDEAVRQEPD
ncbi:MAG: glycosyl hydrolase family 18 protein [Chloroflexi bacterium]|nr:glycosyl hydrolase family 18 protein [Chloroflexota bacterium]MCI0575148.1 glycosyl hydrolase family 18 protein [Chloroflexota bacterium]MCI0647170.1 glycosyl hydrolase family 18 protein [Chloroflexota bacterium]MCI0729954.1 glycosyl hydrolase family 18 protein [Chloroflexota bacterium]